MDKTKTLPELREICKQLKEKGMSVGLITGCFDILHFGHISLFHFAKRRCDVLMVGLDNDKSISMSKGKRHPLFSEDIRAKMLAEMESVDYVFIIQETFGFGTSEADKIQQEILHKLNPSYLITHIGADKYWKKKKRQVKKLGIEFIAQSGKPCISIRSKIIDKLDS